MTIKREDEYNTTFLKELFNPFYFYDVTDAKHCVSWLIKVLSGCTFSLWATNINWGCWKTKCFEEYMELCEMKSERNRCSSWRLLHFVRGWLTQWGWDVRGLVALVAETRRTAAPLGCEARRKYLLGRPGSGCDENINVW